MDLELALNFFDAILIIGVSVPCLYMATKVKQSKLKTLSVLLSTFLIVHGTYHATAAIGALQGYDVVGQFSDVFVEPLGWAIFFVFAYLFLRYST